MLLKLLEDKALKLPDERPFLHQVSGPFFIVANFLSL